jgi:hypothetical protein
MRTEDRVEGSKAEGIRYDEQAGRYETPWGWIKLDFATNDVQVYGPGVNEWFDPGEATRTAALFTAYASPGMAVAMAIHQQYAAWKGAQQLINHKEGR